MKDTLKKGLLASIGFAAYTKDYVKELTAELRKQGYTEAQGRKVFDELVKQGNKTKNEILKKAEQQIRKIMKELEQTAPQAKKHARMQRKTKKRKSR
jgi:polyhydroxyalkanoate synthesis regulator phasin